MVTIDMFRNEADALPFAAGTTIFKEGDAGDMMYVVVDGHVDLLVRGKLVEELGAGGVLGEMALIDCVPRSATAVAKIGLQARAHTRKTLPIPGPADTPLRAADHACDGRAPAAHG